MRYIFTLAALSAASFFYTSSANAACTGTNGRGWGSGNGSGQFSMTVADKTCNISFPGFIDDIKKTRTPATQVTVRSAPKNGKVSVVAGKGLVYTPNAGFKGKDRFCTTNRSPEVKGKALSGCITVTIR